MESLVKFLTGKIGYTIAVILGIFIPGNMFIFVWDRNLYLKLDILKLFVLSFGIPIILYMLMILAFSNIERTFDKLNIKYDSETLLFLILIVNDIVMITFIIIKVINPAYSIKDMLIDILIILLIIAFVMGFVFRIAVKIKLHFMKE